MGYRVALAELLTALGIQYDIGIDGGNCFFKIQYRGQCFERYVHYQFVERVADYLYESLGFSSTNITVFLKRLRLSIDDSILTGRGKLSLLNSDESIFVSCEWSCLRDITEMCDSKDLKELKLLLTHEIGDEVERGSIRYVIPGCHPSMSMLQFINRYTLCGCDCADKVEQILDDAIDDLLGWKLVLIRRLSGCVVVGKLPLNQDGDITVEQVRTFMLGNCHGLSPYLKTGLDYVCELSIAQVCWFREHRVYEINPVRANTNVGEIIDVYDQPSCD